MKKFLLAVLALATLGTVAYAGTQIDEGQNKNTAKEVFVVARFARQPTFPVVVSKDKIVVWDSTSNDGVTVNTTTTSADALVAGVTMDEIPGSSRDNTSTQDLGYSNWGRVQVYGYHVGLVAVGDAKAGGVASAAGDRFATSGTAGSAGLFFSVSPDAASPARDFKVTSQDSAGVIVNRTSATSWDVFIKCM